LSLLAIQDAITALNSLQTNFAVLEAIRKNVPDMNARAMPETIEWFNRIGYKVSFFSINIPLVKNVKNAKEIHAKEVLLFFMTAH